MIDYHMHFEYMEYTEEDMQAFVETGRKRGMTEIGVTEHTHGFEEFKQIYFEELITDDSPLGIEQRKWLEGKRKFFRTLPEYVDFIECMKKRGYPVKLGIEVCYFPGREKEIQEILAPYPWDFIMGSVHFIDGWAFDLSEAKFEWETKNLYEEYEKYSDLLVKMAHSESYDIIGHPYSLMCYGHYPLEDLNELYEKTAREIAKHDICIEVNTGLLYRYPARQMTPPRSFLEYCSRYNIPLSISSDAHHPNDVGRDLDKAIIFAKEAGYEKYNSFDKRKKRERVLKNL